MNTKQQKGERWKKNMINDAILWLYLDFLFLILLYPLL